MAAELCGGTYPHGDLHDAWVRFLANQMHDILPGTSIPEAYELAWNDEVVSLNQFAGVLTDSVAKVASMMDTSGEGIPLVVYNPLSVANKSRIVLNDPAAGLDAKREYIVLDAETGERVGLAGPLGAEWALAFEPEMPACSFRVFRLFENPRPDGVFPGEGNPATPGQTAAGSFSHAPAPDQSSSVESERYRVEFDNDGRIAQIYDKQIERDLLRAPLDLQMLDHGPKEWPAWTIIYDDISQPPRKIVKGPAEPDGARVCDGSRFLQRVRFVPGPYGECIEIEWDIFWRTAGTLLKAAFPLAASNPKATYDLGLGVIERGNNHERLHEVPAQMWAHVADKSGEFGVAVMTEAKFGWDKPDDDTLRLTLLHSPRMTGFKCFLGGANFTDHFLEQEQLDFGHHRIRIRVQGTAGDWAAAKIPCQASALNQPMRAFLVPKHEGPLGRNLQLVKCSSDAVAVKTVKRAEESECIILRLQELEGRAQSAVRISFPAPVSHAAEYNGMEEAIGELKAENQGLVLDFAPFQTRTIGVWLDSLSGRVNKSASAPVSLPYNVRAISPNANRMDGNIDGQGNSLPSEQLPKEIVSGGVRFLTGPRGYREHNAVVCEGQTLELPEGDWTGLHVMAASAADKFTEGILRIGDREERLRVPSYTGWIGQWENRNVGGRHVKDPSEHLPGYVKYARVGWRASHRHSGRGNCDEAYQYVYMFRLDYALGGERTVTLPDDPRLRVFAVSVSADTGDRIVPLGRLYS
jgi:alpha-mannosidase